jgi:hypothetical protein
MAGGIHRVEIDNLASLDAAYTFAGIEGDMNTVGDMRAQAHWLLDHPQEYDDIVMIPKESLRKMLDSQEPALGGPLRSTYS